MTEPTVTIVVPTFARPAYLQQALTSVALQTFPDWECLIVDDASGEAVEPPADPRFRLIERGTNGGPAAARNTGLTEARGRFITFLDDDDLLTPVRMHAAMQIAQASPGTIAVVRLARFDDMGFDVDRRRTARAEERQLRTRFPQLGQVMIPRERLQPFDESLRTAEDAEWWLRVSLTGPVQVSDELGYLLRMHSEQRPGIRHDTPLRDMMYLYRKHEAYMLGNRRARSLASVRIATHALADDQRRLSARWATRSLLAYPTKRATLVLRRALLGP
jgi:glycosyltransferase involved in cell wall biosynthesis